jgi:hypothetical protein
MNKIERYLVEFRYKNIFCVDDGEKEYFIRANNEDDAIGAYENRTGNASRPITIKSTDNILFDKIVYDYETGGKSSLADLIDDHELEEGELTEAKILAIGQ